jgi:hypothetical protein
VVNDTAINVLAELGTATWSPPQAVSYEVAQEAIRQAVGYYAQLVAQEESAAEPDTAAIEGWRAEQVAWAGRLDELNPLNTREVKRIRAAADELLSVDDDDEDDDEDDEDEDEDDELDEEDGEQAEEVDGWGGPA